jgi:hypothetical protein
MTIHEPCGLTLASVVPKRLEKKVLSSRVLRVRRLSLPLYDYSIEM